MRSKTREPSESMSASAMEYLLSNYPGKQNEIFQKYGSKQ